ncbi:hypothetical protein PHO31112_02463 [Pandoraea horticolens]|uniref:Uncharacterized protein n=1 Tax=Pandoraea horticolens TaxID=2508298 RepID=A0A5E4V6J3_9BURK|nr:hypothetical protein PHO31112_02463 [Pandoraea horticolens]
MKVRNFSNVALVSLLAITSKPEWTCRERPIRLRTPQRTAINGIDLVAENVGSDTANGIATIAGVTVNTIQRVQPPVGMTTR